ncbi:telomerase Cajal body protein 1 [Belonocnema kinseyi]|uniref:telomerase Cajal body protein 1 n=1 Tax=Belonocnema kinseyi TaxID=2817044 RepID=UPI00143D1DBE|nr:telomerase Cajal body protein 1 [Belonocnema kinseyi]
MEEKEMETDITLLTMEIRNVSVVTVNTSEKDSDPVSNNSGDLSELSEFPELSKPPEVENSVDIDPDFIENKESNEETRGTECKQNLADNENAFMDVDVSNSQESVHSIILVEKEFPTNLEVAEPQKNISDLEYKWRVRPKLLCSATEEYKPSTSCEKFTKGCQWSPDGTCLMVASEDFRIRIYELPHELYAENPVPILKSPLLKPALFVKEGGLIYDSCWYPYMNSWDPATCCYLTTSQETPIHLWDAFTGGLRATYRAYNQVDEVEPAISVRFIKSGTEIWCGFKGALRKFETDRPGRQTENIFLKNDFPNVTGLVSCIRENPIMPGLLAFGTYSKHIGLYQDGPICSFKTGSGVTQVEFSPCGTKLYSAVRRNNEFFCWDLRNPGVVLWSLEDRAANTNQRIYFDISSDGSTIVSGGTDGFVRIWEVNEPRENQIEAEELNPISRIQLSKDCINGVSLHARLPLLATTSGQRICDEEEKHRDNSVRLWWFGNVGKQFNTTD